jgi:CRISPR-associated protein Csa1
MYFLSEEEKRYLLRRLLPEARENEVHPELRGWNWHNPPLAPIYDVRLGIYEIAGKYCPTSRDVYLRRVMGIKAPPNALMVEGLVLHKVVVEIVLGAKRTIYVEGVDCLEGLRALGSPPRSLFDGLELTNGMREELWEKVKVLWEFEHHRILARVEDILARQPHIGPDALVSLALPVVVEQKLDGSFLGLSPHLSVDAFVFSEPMILDFKFGQRRDFHRLATTGYALVMESLYEFPIDVGCVIYPKFRGERLIIRRDFHLIDDELRQWFIEERDERMRMVEEEIDPGKADECYEMCPYWSECHF